MTNNRPILLAAAICSFSVAAGWYGRQIPFSEQWPYFESLRTTASIVFAIMGAWVALLYPKVLESVLKKRDVESTEDEDRVHALMLPVKLSTAVLVAVMIAGPLGVWLKHFPPALQAIPALRGTAFGLLVFLTLIELVAVVLTLWPIESAKGEIDHIKGHRREMNERFRLTQTREDPPK